jgi:hypothetical protein
MNWTFPKPGAWSSGARAMVLAILAALVITPRAAAAQTQEVFGKVTDSTGAALPGVTVTLSSPSLIQPQTTTTLPEGSYRFTNIPIGTYTVIFELSGFQRLVREGVRVGTGFNAEINGRLDVSSVQETVTVSGESPVVDTKSTTTGATYAREFLESIPTARDPWVIMEQTPGVLMSGQNVGGNKSGQQSTFVAMGSGNNEVWNLDGANITDMPSSSSSLYYDFDSFEEIQIQTGGSDASVMSGGVSINLVTKSGGNKFRGSSRFLVVDHDLSSNNITDELRRQNAGSGNPIQNIKDYGFELGGPIVKNKAWFWGSYGVQDIRVGVVGFVTPGGDPNNFDDLETDLTELKTVNGKVQYQWNSGNKTTFLYNFNNKIRNARGAGPLNPPETTVRQTAPVSTFKLSHQWIPMSRLTIESQLLMMPNGGFVLDLHSPDLYDVQARLDLDTNYNSRSGTSQIFERPQTEIRTDANYFIPSRLGGSHAVKFGAAYRNTPSVSAAHTGGWTTARFRNNVGVEANLTRDSNAKVGLYAVSGYLQDSYTKGRLHLNMGVRADYQDDKARASSIPAQPIIPDLLPAIDFAGADSGVSFLDVSPRFGATWDLRGNGKTLLKASAAQYYGTGISTSGTINPVGTTTLRYPWTDQNGDGFVQRNELDLTRLLNFSSNYNPANPSAFVTPNTVDPNLKNDRTDEILGALEHELVAGLGVSVTYMWRSYPRYSNWTPRLGVSSSDYVPVTSTFACGNTTCDQPGYTVTYWQLPFQQPAAGVLKNQDQRRGYNSLEISARKRYRDRWLMNASLIFQDTRIFYGPADLAYQDPTNVAQQDGAKAGTLNADWSAKLSGMYSFKWGINASGFLNMRQGYPFNRTVQTPTRTGALGQVDVMIDDFGQTRLENFYQVDARLEKGFSFQRSRIYVSADLFNVLNANTVLARRTRQNATNANDAQEILAPRVGRIGVRLTF